VGEHGRGAAAACPQAVPDEPEVVRHEARDVDVGEREVGTGEHPERQCAGEARVAWRRVQRRAEPFALGVIGRHACRRGAPRKTRQLPASATRSKHFAFYYPNAKTLADFAGTYNITAVWQAKGGSDGTDSGTSDGTVQINASGTVAACSVGDFIRCSGGFTLNAKRDGVTFSIPASGGTISGTLSGTVNSTYVLSGSFSGKDSDDGSTLTGTLTGQRR
jgi:hypothetical protein